MKLQYADCADEADSADYINLIIKNFGDLLSAKPVESAQSAYKVLGIKNGKPRLTGNGGWMEQTEFESWVRTNAAERERMKKLSAGLSEEELSRPMGAGWTAAAVLAHLAFWDMRAITLIRKWQKEGVGESPIDTDVVNEATRGLCLAIPQRAAAALALEKATELDGLIAALSHEWVDRIVEIGKTVHLKRFQHRKEHLDEIEKALGKGN
jgi:hypothetical protein